VKQGEELKALDCTIMYITEYIYTQCFIRITQFLLVCFYFRHLPNFFIHFLYDARLSLLIKRYLIYLTYEVSEMLGLSGLRALHNRSTIQSCSAIARSRSIVFRPQALLLSK